MEKYKYFVDKIRIYLDDKTLELNEEKLDELIDRELEKPIKKMDTYLIDLCLDALVAYRKSEKKQNENTPKKKKSI
ncbi:MAG: hypothetical protein IKU08_06610 [Clostridia bacterium]|nr:hypothetical protein [Clostridia bacterium]